MGQNEEQNGLTITLSDGRQLGYIERGNSDKNTIFYFHGWPSSRLELLLSEPFTSYPEARIISIDRPGIGLSDFKNDRKMLDFANDVVELADALQVEKFSIIGYSGGAPFAHACAHKIPERLNSVGIVSGAGPYHIVKRFASGSGRLMLSLSRLIPSLMKMYIGSAYAKPLESENQEEAKAKMLNDLMMNLPDSDKKIMEQPGFFDTLWKQMQEVFINGTKGAALDGVLITKNWGFDLTDIPDEVKIFLWHGQADTNVSVQIGKSVAEEISHCKSVYYAEDGHYSLILNKFDEIIHTLVNT